MTKARLVGALIVLLSAFSFAQDAPNFYFLSQSTAASQAEPSKQVDQKGAVPGQTKVPGENLKAVVGNRLNTASNGHTVTLNCTPSTSPGVTGNNFYRGSTPGGESATPLNATPTGPCTWIDGSVIGTNSYYYTVKAYCPTCNPTLSVASNEVGPVLIPADAAPLPPTNLTTGTITQNHVPLFWNAPVLQGSYDVIATEIFRGGLPTLPSPTRIATVPAWELAYTDPAGCGHSKETCYYYVKSYVVVSDNLFQLSAPSNIAKVTMP
jgi:hypothetical protein